MSTNRTNGQLWIDGNTNLLRYKSNDTLYTMTTNEALNIKDNATGTDFPVGTLVAMDTDGTLKKATFPNDLETIVGIIGISPEDKSTFAIKQGTVVINRGDEVFVDTDNFTEGLPVYWSLTEKGKLTISTPSGFKGFAKEYTGEKGYNVGYDNLPQVGIITSVDTDTVTVYVNIDKFDTSIEWNYPYLHGADNNLENAGCDKYKPNNNEVTINIYHGLYPKMDSEFLPKCKCSIVAIGDDGVEYTVLGSSKFVSDTNGGYYTRILLKTNSYYRYRISGVMNYKYDKDHIWSKL